MKNTLTVNHEKQLIIMDRTFAKKATNTWSEEYDQLQRVRQDYPKYKVVRREIRKNKNKKVYQGLTFKYMEDYIMTHGSDETRKVNLAEFYEMRLVSECHGRAFRYPVIKSWFLEKYPEIVKYGLPTEKETPAKNDSETESTMKTAA